MKIVIAPDSFKESLSAENVVRQLKPGFRPSFPMRTILFADSGWRRRDGGCDGRRDGGNIVTLEVCGPMGEKVNAFLALPATGKQR